MIEIRGDKKGIDWYFVYFAQNTSEYAKEKRKNVQANRNIFLEILLKMKQNKFGMLIK